jgi:hypothetical protein
MKLRGSLPMLIASSHNLSNRFAGLQMSAAYLAANVLSAISVIVGLCSYISASDKFASLPQGVGYGVGVIVGILAAFLFDGLTISSLKRIKSSNNGGTKFFNFLLMGGGIFFSTVAGDQMWALIFSDWRATAFACAVSAVLIATELWHVEHEAAIKKATGRNEVKAHAITEERYEMLETLKREESQEMLKDPAIRQELRESIRESLKLEMKTSLLGSIQVHQEPETGPLLLPTISHKQIAAPQTAHQLDLDSVEGSTSQLTPEQWLFDALEAAPEIKREVIDLMNDQGTFGEAAEILRAYFPGQGEDITPECVEQVLEQYALPAPLEPQKTGIDDYLTKAIELISAHPDATLEEVAKHLGLKYRLDASLWKAKAKTIIAQQQQSRASEPLQTRLENTAAPQQRTARAVSSPRKKRTISSTPSAPRAKFNDLTRAELNRFLDENESDPGFSYQLVADHFHVAKTTARTWCININRPITA